MVTIEDRCENWGQVMRWKQFASVAINGAPSSTAPPKKRYFANAASYETNYRSPQSPHWHYGEAPTAPPEPDVKDAELIEVAACSLPKYQHFVLRYHFVNRLDAPIVLRLSAKAAGEQRGRIGGFTATLAASVALLSAATQLPATTLRQQAVARLRADLGPFQGATQND